MSRCRGVGILTATRKKEVPEFRPAARTFMYGLLRSTHLVVLRRKLLKTCLVRMRISRDTDLLSPNGWHRALRRFILHRNESLLLPPGRRNRAIW